MRISEIKGLGWPANIIENISRWNSFRDLDITGDIEDIIIASNKDQCGDVLLIRYKEMKTLKETAEVLNLTIDQVRTKEWKGIMRILRFHSRSKSVIKR